MSRETPDDTTDAGRSMLRAAFFQDDERSSEKDISSMILSEIYDSLEGAAQDFVDLQACPLSIQARLCLRAIRIVFSES